MKHVQTSTIKADLFCLLLSSQFTSKQSSFFLFSSQCLKQALLSPFPLYLGFLLICCPKGVASSEAELYARDNHMMAVSHQDPSWCLSLLLIWSCFVWSLNIGPMVQCWFSPTGNTSMTFMLGNWC